MDAPADKGTFIQNDKDGTKMKQIPAGEFLAGEEEKFKVYLPSFFLAIHPVTNAQYAHFLSEVQPSTMELKEWILLDVTTCYVRRVGNIYEPHDGKEDHPVVNVSWEGAQAYCEWACLRLPTELEWEKGARGIEGWDYPWGNDWEGGRRCWWGQRKEDWKNQTTCSVWSHPEGCSPWGLYQMVGNVREWCEDWFDTKAYQRYRQNDLRPPQSEGMKTILHIDCQITTPLYLIEELKEEIKYNVLTATTGKEALKILGLRVELEGELYRVLPSPSEIIERHPVVDLVISDIVHPEIDGIELLRVIKERWPDLPFIFFTSQESHKEDFATWGADEYIIKSVDLEELIFKIKEYLDRSARVVRGGSHCDSSPACLRCGYRDCLYPERADICTGFRCGKTSSKDEIISQKGNISKSYKMDLIKLAEQAIKKILGSLDDIPRELANTIANIYYRVFLMYAELGPERVPTQVLRATDMRQGTLEWVEESALLMADMEVIPKAIKSLREIDKYKQPNLYSFAVEYLLDEFKYNIKNAKFKPGIWRKVERLFKKSKVKEIPNLIDLMDL